MFCSMKNSKPTAQKTFRRLGRVLATSDRVDLVEFATAMKPKLVNACRTNPDMENFRKRQVELHYQYSDKKGVTVTTIVLPKDF